MGAHGFLEVVKISTPRISLIPHHDPGPLPIAHGTRPTIGEQVDINTLGGEQEGVVARFGHHSLPILATGHADWLDHLDFPGFCPGSAAKLLSHGLVL